LGAKPSAWHHDTSELFGWAIHELTLLQYYTLFDRFRAVAAKSAGGVVPEIP
jgi:hypothetical protein